MPGKTPRCSPFSAFFQKIPSFSAIFCHYPSFSRKSSCHFIVILRHFLRKSAWNFGCLVSTFLEDYLFANLSLEGAEWVGPDNQEYPFKVNFIFKTQSWDGKRLRVEKDQDEIKISQKQFQSFDPPSWHGWVRGGRGGGASVPFWRCSILFHSHPCRTSSQLKFFF